MMRSITSEISQDSHARIHTGLGLDQDPTDPEVSRLTEPLIREAIAVLFQQGRVELATAVSDAAVSLYPYSEDILVISALLAETEQAWPRAERLLVRLIEVQSDAAPAMTWMHLLRVLCCQRKYADADLVAAFAMERFPGDAQVAEDISRLRDAQAHA